VVSRLLGAESICSGSSVTNRFSICHEITNPVSWLFGYLIKNCFIDCTNIRPHYRSASRARLIPIDMFFFLSSEKIIPVSLCVI